MGSLADYEVLGELGRGGTARVLRARHRPTGSVRALKVISGAVDLEAMVRLRREGEALARLGGDGVVPVHEAGVDGGRAYLALGLMAGGSLRERLRAGAMPWRDACAMVATLAHALERCHAAGLVHRDLKPDNVLFDAPPPDGRPRLADFGAVRDLGATRMTATGGVLGTLAYMAPEQLEGSAVGGAADVYALATVLQEAITGQRLGGASSTYEALREKLRPTHPRPPLARHGAPGALDRLVDRALAVAPGERPTAGGLATELDALVAGEAGGGDARGRWRAGLVVIGALAAGAAGLTAWRARGHDVEGATAAVTTARVDRPPIAPRPIERPPRVEDAVAALRGGRPASEAAALAARALAAVPPPADAERARLREAALGRAREANDARAPDPVAACLDALGALALARTAGASPADGLDAVALARLVDRARERLADERRGASPELLRLAGETVVQLPVGELARAVAKLAESADLTRAADRSALDQAAATLEVTRRACPQEPRTSHALGLLLLHRALEEGRVDLAGPAHAALEVALESRLSRLSSNDTAVAILASARAALLAGRAADAILRLEARRDPDVEVAFTAPHLGVMLEIERARLHLAQRRPREASDRLARAVLAMSDDEALCKALTEAARLARLLTDEDVAGCAELARSLPMRY